MYPFRWVPADGQRHASTSPLPDYAHSYPEGTVILTLCGTELIARTHAHAWLWRTCPDCDIKAHDLAGLTLPAPPRSRRQAR